MREPRLTVEEAAAVLARVAPIPTSRGGSSTRPVSFTLEAASGVSRTLEFDHLEHRVLLLFVSADCHGCDDLLRGPREPTAFGLTSADEVLLVTRSSEMPDTRAEEEIWFSPEAFGALRVSGAPFFCLLDPSFDTVATEGVVWGLDSIRDAVARVLAGAPEVDVPRLEMP